MKLCVVILLCACSFAVSQNSELLVQADDSATSEPESSVQFEEATLQRDLFLEKVRKFIEDIIKRGESQLQAINQGSKILTNKFERDLNQSTEVAGVKLEFLLKSAKERLGKLGERNEIAKECATKYSPELEESIKNARKGLKNCRDAASEQWQTAGKLIQPLVEDIMKNVGELRQLAEQCWNSSSNIVEAVQCVFAKGAEIREKQEKIIADIKNILIIASEKLTALVNTARACISNVVVNAYTEIQEILMKVQKCIDENQSSTTPTSTLPA